MIDALLVNYHQEDEACCNMQCTVTLSESMEKDADYNLSDAGTSYLYARRMEYLETVTGKLSQAQTIDEITPIVCHAARTITGADGATFVLRDQGFCHYKDEDAIAPLWKGQRFHLEICISGWAMIHRQAAVIKDIYKDIRIPEVAYRHTFVKSLVMVPIHGSDPIGSLGAYWASQRQPTPDEVEFLQLLADKAAEAMKRLRNSHPA